MEKDKIEEAVKYAATTNKIENQNLDKNELQIIKEAIMESKSDKSFLQSVVKITEEVRNGKTK